ncbi:MAG: AAA family ATPase [Muribaculaceae bacterium]|nr:AAA family ATPase [Muribaculaceae bacterium]
MNNIGYDKNAWRVLKRAIDLADDYSCEFITPEVLLKSFLADKTFVNSLKSMGVSATIFEEMHSMLDDTIAEQPKLDDDSDGGTLEDSMSQQMLLLIANSIQQAITADRTEISAPMMVTSLLELEDSWAANILLTAIDEKVGELIATLLDAYEGPTDQVPGDTPLMGDGGPEPDADKPHQSWHDLVVCVNDHIHDHNPLIGREAELDRTIQVLCRKDKNNPLHLGEPGVGKTSLIYGLAERIERGDVPDNLMGARIYELDLASLIAGTQFRGDFEKRIKTVMEGASEEGNTIIYIDEIHNIVGAGQTGQGSLDASNMLKPYLEGGRVRFIGATTYEEFNRNISRSKGLMRRFQTIDVAEPSVDEAIKIIKALKETYESFHGVTYNDDALEMAVKASAKHIPNRYLPDKAIDLIDEAGAMMQMNKSKKTNRVVDTKLIAQVLAKVARVNALEEKDSDDERLMSLKNRVLSSIYGQDNAVTDVVEAVQMSKAGLLDPGKPLASLLFVGPTGVGKTEVARVLARELGVELVRFDMSEYMEKHTVAKLIGSPAGYVGYDDGGLLTDAVRRSPDCVLLLDEIEKAHEDIFNILLQVMDYGTLTDNKGRKAHFQNVVIIMTSNAGAQWAHSASVGFASTATAGGAMLKKVKQTFKPEFLNRLSGVVVFNDMDRTMASMILDKKLRELRTLLASRNVKLNIAGDAREALITEGYSREYGAREMDRVIHNRVKTMLMKEILFGRLKQGGTARLVMRSNGLALNIRQNKN